MTPRERKAINKLAWHAMTWFYAIAACALICLATVPDEPERIQAGPVEIILQLIGDKNESSSRQPR